VVKSVVIMTKESRRHGEPRTPEELTQQFATDIEEQQLDEVVVDSFVIEHPQVVEVAVREELVKIKRRRARKAR